MNDNSLPGWEKAITSHQDGGSSGPVHSPRPGRLRRAAGVLGEILMTLGVLVLLFLAWQLWWTDRESSTAQDSEAKSLDEGFQRQAPSVRPPRGTPVPTATKLVSAQTPVGTSFAVMYVPRFGSDFRRPVIQGTQAPELAVGIGHEPTSVMPGQIGNFATAGHRVTYGKPFNRIDTLRKGDFVVVETSDGWSIYRHQRSRIVAPTEVSVLAPVPDRPGVTPTQAWMTMVACHPKFSAA